MDCSSEAQLPALVLVCRVTLGCLLPSGVLIFHMLMGKLRYFVKSLNHLSSIWKAGCLDHCLYYFKHAYKHLSGRYLLYHFKRIALISESLALNQIGTIISTTLLSHLFPQMLMSFFQGYQTSIASLHCFCLIKELWIKPTIHICTDRSRNQKTWINTNARWNM